MPAAASSAHPRYSWTRGGRARSSSHDAVRCARTPHRATGATGALPETCKTSRKRALTEPNVPGGSALPYVTLLLFGGSLPHLGGESLGYGFPHQSAGDGGKPTPRAHARRRGGARPYNKLSGGSSEQEKSRRSSEIELSGGAMVGSTHRPMGAAAPQHPLLQPTFWNAGEKLLRTNHQPTAAQCGRSYKTRLGSTDPAPAPLQNAAESTGGGESTLVPTPLLRRPSSSSTRQRRPLEGSSTAGG